MEEEVEDLKAIMDQMAPKTHPCPECGMSLFKDEECGHCRDHPEPPIEDEFRRLIKESDEVLAQKRSELVLRPDSPMVAPVDIEEAQRNWRMFGRLKTELLTKDDFIQFESKNRKGELETKTAVVRSGWLKIAAFFNLSDRIVEKSTTKNAKGYTNFAEFVVEVRAPNGRTAQGWGACSGTEERGSGGWTKPDHDIPATAHTRALNRAIANMVGGAEVSGEEYGEDSAGGY